MYSVLCGIHFTIWSPPRIPGYGLNGEYFCALFCRVFSCDFFFFVLFLIFFPSQPKKGQEKKLERTLCKLYSYLGETYDDGEDEKDEKTQLLLGQEKFFPYVFLELDIGFGNDKQN